MLGVKSTYTVVTGTPKPKSDKVPVDRLVGMWEVWFWFG